MKQIVNIEARTSDLANGARAFFDERGIPYSLAIGPENHPVFQVSARDKNAILREISSAEQTLQNLREQLQ